MIKAQARICGVISQSAAVRMSKDNSEFLAFAVKLAVPGSRKGDPGMDTFISVSVDGSKEDAGKYLTGQRFEAEGKLYFRKSGDSLYLNFHTELINENPSMEDGIEGTLEFKGTVGKSVDEKTTAKGSKFVTFSAFSTEKTKETFVFTWVRFLKFDAATPPFLVPKAKIEARGKLEITSYSNNLSLGCRFDEIKPWGNQSSSQQNANEKTPF